MLVIKFHELIQFVNHKFMLVYFFVGLPYTGRMHQIRVHLQWLGYPIVNDPIYNHEAWGPRKGKAGHIEKDIDSVRI